MSHRRMSVAAVLALGVVVLIGPPADAHPPENEALASFRAAIQVEFHD